MRRPSDQLSLTQEDVAGRLRRAVNRLQRRLRQESLGGLSPAQASALGSVSRHGSPTLGELAAIEQVQPPTITRIVANLTEAGMVTRVADPNDRRSARVRITPAGERALERMRSRKNAFLLRRLDQLSADEQRHAAELVALLEHLLGGAVRHRVRAAGRRTFLAISVRNYRLYFTGQVISVSGTWMQTVAQAYLILFVLHGTGVDVAIATSLQFLPLLLFGPFGGLIADRLDKRKVLYATQAAAGVLALIFGVLVAFHCDHPARGLSAGDGTRRRQPVRQPGPSDLRLGDGGARPAPERGEPQQRPHELGPGDRARHRGRADPHGRRRHVLLPQRCVLRRRDRCARHDAGRRALPPTGRAVGPRARCAKGCATSGRPPTSRSHCSPWPSSASLRSTSR